MSSHQEAHTKEQEIDPRIVRGMQRAVSSVSQIFFMGDKFPVTIDIKDFDHPSVGARFARADCRIGQAVAHFFVKDYLKGDEEDNESDMGWAKNPTRKSRAKTEHALMRLYRSQGFLAVPDSFIDSTQPNLLYMCNVGDISLERKLRGDSEHPANPANQEKVLKEALLVLAQLHVIGKQEEFNLPSRGDYDRILAARNFGDIGGLLLDQWIGHEKPYRELRSDFADAFRPLADYLGHGPKQLIHGDLSTFHILCDNGNFSIIDFEKAKAGFVTQDLAGILCSPEVIISPQQKEELLKQYKREYETLNSQISVSFIGIKRAIKEAGKLLEHLIEINDADMEGFLKNYNYAEAFECFRRGAKIANLRKRHSTTYSRFVEHYPGFQNAVARYVKNLAAGVVAMEANSARYTKEEVTQFKRFSEVVRDIANVAESQIQKP